MSLPLSYKDGVPGNVAGINQMVGFHDKLLLSLESSYTRDSYETFVKVDEDGRTPN